jgi:hypothetical protein
VCHGNLLNSFYSNRNTKKTIKKTGGRKEAADSRKNWIGKLILIQKGNPNSFQSLFFENWKIFTFP